MGLTAISIYAPGDFIASAWANILRTNFGVLDSRTGGDPAAAGKFLHSDGSTSAAWVAAGSLTDNIATTGSLAAGTTVTASGAVSAGSYTGGSTSSGAPSVQGLNVGASGVGVAGAGGVNVSGGGPYQGGTKVVGTSLQVKGLDAGTNGITSDGAIASSAGVSGTTGAFSSAVSGASGSYSGDLAAGGNLGVTGSGTFSGAVGSPRFLSSVADGATPPFVANAAQAAVVCTGVKAQYAVQADAALGVADGAVSTSAKMGTGVVTSTNILDGTIVDGDVAAANKDGAAGTPSLRTLGTGAAQAAAGNHTHASTGSFQGGTYSGNNAGTQSIGLAFTPKFVFIQRTDSVFSQWMFAASGSTIPQLNPSASNGSTTAPTISGASFVVTSGSGTNASGGANNYSYAAWG